MFQRHQLIYLKPDADFSIRSIHSDIDFIRSQTIKWFKKGLPSVCARQTVDDALVHLGLPLHIEGVKHRVSVYVAQSSIVRQEPLPKLINMQSYFREWYGIEGLDLALTVMTECNVSVYGSFLFQYLSGETLVDETSDLDLFIDYAGFSLGVLNELCIRLGKLFKRRIDGEVRFKHHGDISIKELLNVSTQTLLCKHLFGVELLTRAEIYERYPSLSCL